MMPAVSFKSSSGSLAVRQRMRGQAVDAALKAQARAYGEMIKRKAISLSQGSMTTAQMRGYRPGFYSVARTGNLFNDALINRQTGDFAASWYSGTWAFSGHVTVTVWNSSKHAQFMLGTARMRKRDILGRATGTIKPFSLQMLEAKRQGERSMGGSLLLELVQVGVSVGVAYGGAAFEG